MVLGNLWSFLNCGRLTDVVSDVDVDQTSSCADKMFHCEVIGFRQLNTTQIVLIISPPIVQVLLEPSVKETIQKGFSG